MSKRECEESGETHNKENKMGFSCVSSLSLDWSIRDIQYELWALCSFDADIIYLDMI